MSPRDRIFALGTLALSVVPVALLAGAPFDEARATLGVLVGWSVALLVMVPSYVLLSRSMGDEQAQRFVRAFMLGSLMRLVLMAAASMLFVVLVADAPILSFLVSFLLGYVLLTILELTLVLRQPGQQTSREASA